jgi:hypothetical protein
MQTLDTRYVFRFVHDEGRQYTRTLYWEDLHVLEFAGGRVLAASRVVPHNDDLFAFYVSLRRAILRAEDDRKLLEEGTATPQLPEGSEEERLPALSGPTERALVARNSEKLLALTVQREQAELRRGGGGLSARNSSVSVSPGFGGLQAAADGGGSSGGGALPPVPTVPPHLRPFLSSHYTRLSQIVGRYEERDELDSRYHAERLQSLIGRAEAEALDIQADRRVVVLGRIVEGEAPPDPADPQRTSRSYRVDPEANHASVLLEEVRGGLRRVLVSRLLRWTLHGNVAEVRFVDELRGGG